MAMRLTMSARLECWNRGGRGPRLLLLRSFVVTLFIAAPLALSSTIASAVSTVTFVVNSTADRPDATADGVCATTVALECSLRAALTEADTVTSAPVLINFAIPGTGVHRINVLTRLPLINNGTAGITIDGFTQPGSAVNTDPLVDNGVRTIEIVGTGPNGIDGLIFTGSHNTGRGVSIHGFLRAIRMTGTASQFNAVTGNIVGLKPDGTPDDNYSSVVGSPCIDINSGASQNRVGLPGNANRNVISGCYEKGITFYNEFTWKNYVQNNLIGLDPTGTINRANFSMGIDINWSANGTIIGGTAFQERNVISGNDNSGIEISHGTGTVNNKVIGNFIGTDPTGNSASAATANRDLGVRLEGKPDCGTSPCPTNDEGSETVTDNVIVNSGWGGILVYKGTHDSLIANNRIGVTANGTVVGNSGFGIRLAAGATHITIGPGNAIAGAHAGIQLNPYGSDPPSNISTVTQYNTITRNSITTTSGLGVDFLPYGSVNQGGNGSPALNQKVDPPVLTPDATDVLATTCAGCTVELFTSAGNVGSPGLGTVYLATMVADSSGEARFVEPGSGWPAVVTATTTTTQGSTSEFAPNLSPGPIAVTSLVPGTLGQSASWRTVKLNGSGFQAGATVSLGSSDIVVKSLVVTSPNLLTLMISVASNATLGSRTVTVINPGGGSASCVCFTVAAAPTVTSVSPNTLSRGDSIVVDVVGTQFRAGVKVTLSGTGVTVGTVTRVDSTHLRVALTAASSATLGGRDMRVTNADAGYVIKTAAITVTT